MVSCQDEWEIYQEILFNNAQQYELIGKSYKFISYM